MGKNIKGYATIPNVHFPREREGSLMARSPNLPAKIKHGLTVHTFDTPVFKNYEQNFKFSNRFFGQNYSESCKFCSICPQIPANYVKFATKFIHIHSIISDF